MLGRYIWYGVKKGRKSVFDKTIVYQGILGHIEGYEQEYGKKPTVIALGKTHLEDMHDYMECRDGKLWLNDIEVIDHNDPVGITMAHNNNDNP